MIRAQAPIYSTLCLTTSFSCLAVINHWSEILSVALNKTLLPISHLGCFGSSVSDYTRNKGKAEKNKKLKERHNGGFCDVLLQAMAVFWRGVSVLWYYSIVICHSCSSKRVLHCFSRTLEERLSMLEHPAESRSNGLIAHITFEPTNWILNGSCFCHNSNEQIYSFQWIRYPHEEAIVIIQSKQSISSFVAKP